MAALSCPETRAENGVASLEDGILGEEFEIEFAEDANGLSTLSEPVGSLLCVWGVILHHHVAEEKEEVVFAFYHYVIAGNINSNLVATVSEHVEYSDGEEDKTDVEEYSEAVTPGCACRMS